MAGRRAGRGCNAAGRARGPPALRLPGRSGRPRQVDDLVWSCSGAPLGCRWGRALADRDGAEQERAWGGARRLHIHIQDYHAFDPDAYDTASSSCSTAATSGRSRHSSAWAATALWRRGGAVELLLSVVAPPEVGQGDSLLSRAVAGGAAVARGSADAGEALWSCCYLPAPGGVEVGEQSCRRRGQWLPAAGQVAQHARGGVARLFYFLRRDFGAKEV